MNLIRMNYSDWEEQYMPLQFKDDGRLIQEWSEKELLKADSQHRLWTIVEGDSDDAWYIVEGARKINYVGHVITKLPYKANLAIECQVIPASA